MDIKPHSFFVSPAIAPRTSFYFLFHVTVQFLILNLFGKAILWSNGLVVKLLDSQSRSSVFRTTGCLQGRLSLSSFQGRYNEYQEFLGT